MQWDFACSDCAPLSAEKTHVFLLFPMNKKEKMPRIQVDSSHTSLMIFFWRDRLFQRHLRVLYQYGQIRCGKSLFCQDFDQILVIFLSSGNSYSPGAQCPGRQAGTGSYYQFINSKHTYIPCSMLYCCLFRACLFIINLKGDVTQCHVTFLPSNLIQSQKQSSSSSQYKGNIQIPHNYYKRGKQTVQDLYLKIHPTVNEQI